MLFGPAGRLKISDFRNPLVHLSSILVIYQTEFLIKRRRAGDNVNERADVRQVAQDRGDQSRVSGLKAGLLRNTQVPMNLEKAFEPRIPSRRDTD